MLRPMTFDELNKLVGYKRSMPYSKYFGEMVLTNEQKSQRIMLANEIEDELIYPMSLMFTQAQFGNIDRNTAIENVRKAILVAVSSYINVDSTSIDYIDDTSIEIVDTTIKNIDEPYCYSNDRMRFIAENESSTHWNYQDNKDAITQGYERKKWITMMDTHVRLTHKQTGGIIKPIDEPFYVGGSLLDYPRDMKYGADANEIVNCRCSMQYL